MCGRSVRQSPRDPGINSTQEVRLGDRLFPILLSAYAQLRLYIWYHISRQPPQSPAPLDILCTYALSMYFSSIAPPLKTSLNNRSQSASTRQLLISFNEFQIGRLSLMYSLRVSIWKCRRPSFGFYLPTICAEKVKCAISTSQSLPLRPAYDIFRIARCIFDIATPCAYTPLDSHLRICRIL